MTEKLKPTLAEKLTLTPGAHAYLIADVSSNNIDRFRGLSQEEIQEEMDKYAVLVNEARLKVENQGGTFLGIRLIKADIPDEEWQGSSFPHVQTFLLADFQPL